jgi:hypothetical protein
MKLHHLCALLASSACSAVILAPRTAHAIKIYENEDSGTSLSVGGYIQPYFRWVDDACLPTGGDPADCNINITNDGFGFDRARLNVSGNTNGIAEFNLEFDGLPNTRVLEAQMTFEPVDSLKLQLGLFKVPFQRSELVSDSRRQFITRAENIRVAPGRQLGLSVEYGLPASLSGLPDDLFVVMLGLFNGERPAENPLTTNIDERFLTVARLEVHPFGRPARLFEGDTRPLDERSEPVLSIGANFAHNRFEPEDWEQDNFGGDIFFAWQGLSIYADYIRNNRNYESIEAGTDQFAAGYNIQAGYFIPAPYVEEHLELVARLEQFDLRTAAREEDAEDLVPNAPLGGPAAGSAAEQEQMAVHGGINWYFAGHDLKLQAQYVHRIGKEDWRLSATDSSIGNEFDDDTFYLQATYRF